ncbi:MAG TPA: pyruvate kinase alpha/beta domain-containing protein, partial [Mobilitalea sp.]|nr:pyruvate kinase alpha/beta domain-containing protein [Mobilitalea sp.]
EHDTFELFEHAIQAVEKAGYIKHGELAVMTAGVPLGVSGTTNIIKVQIAGDTDCKKAKRNPKSAS